MKKGELDEYGEERVPFNDVLRTLLKAKPKRKTAKKPKHRKWLVSPVASSHVGLWFQIYKSE